jgi:hypothetical protein
MKSTSGWNRASRRLFLLVSGSWALSFPAMILAMAIRHKIVDSWTARLFLSFGFYFAITVSAVIGIFASRRIYK